MNPVSPFVSIGTCSCLYVPSTFPLLVSASFFLSQHMRFQGLRPDLFHLCMSTDCLMANPAQHTVWLLYLSCWFPGTSSTVWISRFQIFCYFLSLFLFSFCSTEGILLRICRIQTFHTEFLHCFNITNNTYMVIFLLDEDMDLISE